MDYESLLNPHDFKDTTVRQAFIRKVYSILMVQLAITTAIVSIFLFNEALRDFALAHYGFFLFLNILSVVIFIAMGLFQEFRRSYPINFIALGVFTVVQAVTLGFISVMLAAEQVLYAAAITCAICLAVTAFSFQTRVDITMWGGFLLISSLALILFSIFVIFFPSKTLVFLMGCIGAVLFSLYLLYDTQLMMGGYHKYAISPEEYIFAALNLYLDIVTIFLSILNIMES